MKLGYFDDDAREYVITNPKTPYPWINYLGHEEFFCLLSNTGGGYSFYRDAKYRRLTRYRYNNVPVDTGGKYFYIKDGDTVWSPGWKPAKTSLDHYECRHGMGYTTIETEKNDVRVTASFYVPVSENAEVHLLKIQNRSASKKKLQLFSLVEWCLWNAEDDMTNFQRNYSTGEVEVEGSVIYHKTEYRERRNHFAFYAANRPIDGFDTDRDKFLGVGNGFDMPEAVIQGKPYNSLASGWSPIASHAIELEIESRDSQEVVFVLGYEENNQDDKWLDNNIINKTKAKATISRLGSPDKAKEALENVKRYWKEKLGNFSIHTSDDKLNRMVNTWNQYQCMVTFNFSRSASYFESGIGRGMGFRDSNQDLIGVLHLEPERARERILDIAATQMEDGSAFHQYQPLTKRGNAEIGSNFNDDPLWLIQSVTCYLKETGDFLILGEEVPFGNDESNKGSLFDHLTASFDHVINNLGPHGLPLIGRADWNDCLNLNCFSTDPNESFQTTGNAEGTTAESVLIAGMFVYFGRDYLELCRYLGKHDEANRSEKCIETMIAAIEEHGWDGKWFLRAYDSNGEKVGSRDNSEGKIFVESQGFCVMAGIGLNNGNAEKALDSVAEHLSTEHGVVLCFPAYQGYQLNLGEISTYPPGYKENGGIFCHNNPWIMIAETKLRRSDLAFEYYTKIAPAYQDEKLELHKTEPYVYAQMIAGKEAVNHGEAKNSWLTGTAAWNYHTITEHILGIKPGYDGLVIDPCIPKSLTVHSILRKFRGATYRIDFQRLSPGSTDVRNILIDGQLIEGNQLPVKKAGELCHVVVELV